MFEADLRNNHQLREEQEEIYSHIKNGRRDLEAQEQAQVAQAVLDSDMQDLSYEVDHTQSQMNARGMAVQNAVRDVDNGQEVRKNRKKKNKRRRDTGGDG